MAKLNYIKLHNDFYSKEPNYKYPFEELKAILESFELKLYPWDADKFKYALDNFTQKLSHHYNVPKDEVDNIKFNYYWEDNNIKIYCGNMFTACLIFGRYVPLFIIKMYKKKYEFSDGSMIKYDKESEKYIFYEKQFKKIKLEL